MEQRASNKTAGLAAYGLFFTGVALILLSVLGAETWHWVEWLVHFVRDIGLLLAAVMAGTILHEKLLRDEMVANMNAELDEKLRLNRGETARAVHSLLSEHPPTMTGIRKLSEVRRGFGGYYRWVTEQTPQELFFAGRSVLHRIDADIRARIDADPREETQNVTSEVIFRRLKEGSKINILFLDPRIGIIERLADEEGQTLSAMLGDINTSLEICEKLGALLERRFQELPVGAELSIRVYDRVPYFAYHKQDQEVIVGFYFDSAKGSTSAAYELVDDETKKSFEDHFAHIRSLAASNTIVEFEGARGRPMFGNHLIERLKASIREAEYRQRIRTESAGDAVHSETESI